MVSPSVLLSSLYNLDWSSVSASRMMDLQVDLEFFMCLSVRLHVILEELGVWFPRIIENTYQPRHLHNNRNTWVHDGDDLKLSSSNRLVTKT